MQIQLISCVLTIRQVSYINSYRDNLVSDSDPNLQSYSETPWKLPWGLSFEGKAEKNFALKIQDTVKVLKFNYFTLHLQYLFVFFLSRLSRNQVQLVACKAPLFQYAKDLSSLILIFNLCSIFCSFASNVCQTQTTISLPPKHYKAIAAPTSPTATAPACFIPPVSLGAELWVALVTVAGNRFARLVNPLLAKIAYSWLRTLTKNGRTPLGNPSRQLEPTVWPAPSCLETDASKAVTLARAAVSVEMEERMDKKSAWVATIST
jgi:hypothetical protein